MQKASWWLVLIFWVINIAAALVFRHGGIAPEMRWPCFVIGNVLGVSSTCVLMKIYAHANVNVANVVCNCGTFIALQLVLWFAFHATLTLPQWLGLTLLAAGTALVLAKPASPSEQPATIASEPHA